MKTLEQDFPAMPFGPGWASANNGLAKLREDFPAHQISKLPKPTKAQTEEVRANFKAGIRCDICGGWHHPKVVHLDYVCHAALTDRLLDADPSWYWEPLAVGPNGLPALDSDGGMWIKLTVCGVTRLGYGDAQGKTGGDAMKERIGDALRNAAMRFGAALDLWHKGDLHIETVADTKTDEDIDAVETQAMPIRVMYHKGDIEGAYTAINSLGINGEYDSEAKELIWGVLDSKIRSTLKAFDIIIRSADLSSLTINFEAAPLHAKDALRPYASNRKTELLNVPEQEAA